MFKFVLFCGLIAGTFAGEKYFKINSDVTSLLDFPKQYKIQQELAIL